MKENLEILRIQARKNLAQRARELRALRGTEVEKELGWVESDEGIYAEVDRGRIYLYEKFAQKAAFEVIDPYPPTDRRVVGVSYTSNFGPNSDKSFSGYLPGLTLEEAKKLVYHDASRHW
jgi:hypothetical protein